MGQYDCRICNFEHSKMLTPVQYRGMFFCSEGHRDEYKQSHPRIAKANRPVSTRTRCPGMGSWPGDGGYIG